MTIPSTLYGQSLALLTDLYELTMAYGYWKEGLSSTQACFHMAFRSNPFGGGYTLVAGLDYVIDYLTHFRFDQSDLDYLGSLRGNDGAPLFPPEFLDHLRQMEFSCDVDALPEGTVAFPYEPLIRIQGPILQAQLLETVILDIVNFQTLIATKAARVCQAAAPDPVLEFGLRRAQGIDGGISASRAAYIGGCEGTSNVLAGKLFGIPVRGTHAHSWVMTFEDELDAFLAYADAMPNNCVFLVDTYHTLEGVRNAVRAGERLRQHGYKMTGIRLDSGDLAYLSIQARKILDDAGFGDAIIVASNDLDEWLIESLKHQGAAITSWGVGTKLVTAFDQPALGGVYKLGAVRHHGQPWQYRVKVSEQAAKSSIPGIPQVRRYSFDGTFMADAIYDIASPPEHGCTIIDPVDITRRRHVEPGTHYQDLLLPVFRQGKFVGERPSLEQIRVHARRQVERLHPTIRRFANPHRYPAGLEQELHELRTRLILATHSEEQAEQFPEGEGK